MDNVIYSTEISREALEVLMAGYEMRQDFIYDTITGEVTRVTLICQSPSCKGECGGTYESPDSQER